MEPQHQNHGRFFDWGERSLHDRRMAVLGEASHLLGRAADERRCDCWYPAVLVRYVVGYVAYKAP